MKFRYIHTDNCHDATGLVVAIDVLRAFTTAAYAFANGVEKILLVETVAEAFALREQYPGALITGEVRGIPPEGFDFGNSPTELMEADLNGHLSVNGRSDGNIRTLIQRTSAGTRGVVACTRAKTILTSSFVCAQATADIIRDINPKSVDFLITGYRSSDQPDGYWGDDDAAFAEYLKRLLRGESPDIAPYFQRVRHSRSGLSLIKSGKPAHFSQDVERAMELDRFDFGMQVYREGQLLVMKKRMPKDK